MFGETAQQVENRATRLQQRVGAHAVYLAALEDPKIKDRLDCNDYGTLRYMGRTMGPRAYASMLIYLSGKYKIRPTEYELKAGLLGAARRGAPMSEALNAKKNAERLALAKKCKAWAAKHGDNFTTEQAAEALMGEAWMTNQRSTQMSISAALRTAGLMKRRRRVDGKRTYVWLNPSAEEIDATAEIIGDRITHDVTAAAGAQPDTEHREPELPDASDFIDETTDEEHDQDDFDPIEMFDDQDATASFTNPEHTTPFDDHEDQYE